MLLLCKSTRLSSVQSPNKGLCGHIPSPTLESIVLQYELVAAELKEPEMPCFAEMVAE